MSYMVVLWNEILSWKWAKVGKKIATHEFYHWHFKLENTVLLCLAGAFSA